MQILVDTHSHTIASGHAYSTLSEMARAAARKGLQALAVTEHAPQLEKTCGLFYFMNYDVIPREMNGVRLLMGAELNIMDSDGTVDLPEDVCRGLDIAIASIHPPCYQSEASVENNTRAYVEVMKKPYVNIIGHPDDGRYEVDYEALVQGAKEYGKILEVNNHSLVPNSFRQNARENDVKMLKFCMKYQVPVVMDSDAHFDTHIAEFDAARVLLEELDFPEELVVNHSVNALRGYINAIK